LSYYALWTVVAVVCASIGVSDAREHGLRHGWGWLAGCAGAVALMTAVSTLS